MSSSHYGHQADDSLEIYSSDEGDNSQQEYNNLRLTQAINYLAEEGGNDSPATYMSRVDRIDEALVQLLPQSGQDFDRERYRTVRAMVQEAQEAYENAVDEANLSAHRAEFTPKYSTASAPEALYRGDDNAPEPSSNRSRMRSSTSAKSVQREKPQKVASFSIAPAVKPLRSRHGNSPDNVDLERNWHYGGSNNQVEKWYRNMPASLPFPETHLMEHWETLKINFDVSDYGRKLKAEGKFLETNIPFNHPALEQYKNLHHFESGSRFKLPHGSQEDYDRIRRFATKELLSQTVENFNEGDKEEEKALDYAPRIFLGQFSVGRQAKPAPDLETALRDALRTTPTKSPRLSSGTLASSASSKTAEIKIATLKAAGDARRERATAAQKLRAQADALEQGTVDIDPTSAKQTTPVQPSTRAGAAMRKFGGEREKAVSHSPRRESILAGALSSPEDHSSTASTLRTVTPMSRSTTLARKIPTPSLRPTTPSIRGLSISPSVSTPTPTAKKTRGRSRRNPLPPTPNTPPALIAPVVPPITPAAAAPTPRLDTAVKSGSKPGMKRKHSVGSDYYTPDGKRKKSLGSEEFIPLTKTLRSATSDKSATRSVTPKKVGFVELSSGSESESVSEGDLIDIARPAVVARPAVGVSKAVAAGKQMKKRIVRETVVETTTKVRKVVSGKGVTSSTLDELKVG
ncbi:hypothetical protein T440DRAFT_484836 [Plenodomus tracheiphilus IPT5]|uniref:Uncharacterized protein n=1 Tax=Plenodomus tracheiphilus IPT5 TaxID=1408161 RepID=A0A6A7BMP4_9PLEO|nr:hypothetical protein T440DRAFT_484836 [Plenodomus tracheiphilus IPT5]